MFESTKKIYYTYSPIERKNIAIYILGIMFYKFGLEAFNGSIITLATDRFAKQAFTKLGILQGLNQAFQCVGSILIAPLIRRFPTRTVLAAAVMSFGLLTAILMIADAATGGSIKKKGGKVQYGSWDPNALFPVFSAAGIVYGMVELIRRVIPRDIVGGDVSKLRRMDATVHVFYEIAGTSGAITTTYLVLRFGNNYSFLITPIFFSLACITWSFISVLDFVSDKTYEGESYFIQIGRGTIYFGQSIARGAKIIFSGRKFMWLPLGYSLALYGHRYLESGVAPVIAKRVFEVSAYSQIMVGGSNFGELLGAVSVFLLNDYVPTPIPWLRVDALLLLITWVIPYYYPPYLTVRYAWYLALIFIPISYGWAAGDVSLAAYIQACLARKETESDHVSALGAVMAFLYSTYIILYAIMSPTLGKYIDRVYEEKDDAHPALVNIAGVQFTILGAILLCATLIPAGALSINPRLLFGEDLHGEVSDDDKVDGTHEVGSGDIPIPIEESFVERPPIPDHKHESEKDRASDKKGHSKE